jgi:hypothetical protein
MSESAPSPGGLSPKEFKSVATEIGQWLWGTVQGAFNEKQTVSQIITDAVIGMIPLLGDVTAVRDLIAVGIGLADDHKKREETFEWVLLVILIFALIPVIGGVIKGVGRLSLRAARAAAADSKLLAETADDIIQFLNRVGHKNAEAWFKALNVLSYQAEILSKFRALCDTMIRGLCQLILRGRKWLPQSLVSRMEQLSEGFKQLKALGDKMIPQALKELHAQLEKIQKYVHAGGKPVKSRAEVMYAQTGQKTVTYMEEARAIEGNPAKRIRRAGKYEQNCAPVDDPAAIAKIYKHEPGYPDLLKRVSDDGVYYPAIAAASGKITNEMLSGVTLYRSFGPPRFTHGVKVGESFPAGAFWGVGKPPASAEKWRDPAAVLDEWNGNERLCLLHIPANVKLPACVSTVSEQFSKTITGQYLEGGARQALIENEKDVIDLVSKLADSDHGKIVLPSGISVEVRPSGWTDVNGIIGYDEIVIPFASVVERLGITEKQSKTVQQASQAAAKNERAKTARSPR